MATSCRECGIPVVGNQMLEMNVSGRIVRFTITGAASALEMNLTIPIPSVVNAAVPRTSVRTRPGTVARRRSTP